MFNWKPEYELRSEHINRQHQHLFKLANRLFSLQGSPATKQELRELILELIRYIQTHFQDEETYMQKLQYPDLHDHHAKHEQIIGEMNEVLLSSHHLSQLKTGLHQLLKKWIQEHIENEDMKIKKFEQPE